MLTNGLCARSATIASSIFVLTTGAAGQVAPAVEEVLARVADQVERYYQRVQNIICTEKVTAQPIATDLSIEGFARVLEYELHVDADAPADADGGAAKPPTLVRELKKVNGRAPRPHDSETTNSCFDPSPLSAEPLSFLLPGNRSSYRFTSVAYGKGSERNMLILNFAKTATGRPSIVEDENNKPECFHISLPVGFAGKLWIDAQTYDVLRLEQHLAGRVDFRVPVEQQRRHHLPDIIVVDRYDTTIRYKPVTFTAPEERVVLPQSIEVLAVVPRMQSHRKRQVFSDFRRFMTSGRVVKEPPL